MVKPHVVLVPYPAQGHVNPLMRLAKLLHSRGSYITFVNTEYNHRRLVRSQGPESMKGLPDFKFEAIPDGLPPSDGDATQDVPMLCYSTRKTCLGPFKELLSRLNSTPGVPPVSCVVSDGVMTFGMMAAQQMGIPDVQLWTASACSFIGYLHYRELIKRGIVPFKNGDYLTDGTLQTRVDWVNGMVDVCLKDLPSFFQTTDPDDIMFDFLGEEAQNCLNGSAILFNTFDGFEEEALEAVKSKFNFSNIYTIGPLSLLDRHISGEVTSSIGSSLWKPDPMVYNWLDEKNPESVVYVNYGSVTTMTSKHFHEFALGLMKSKVPFLWIVRPDIVKGESAMLPVGFLEEIKDRGLLVSWCAQDKVLAHKSVGAFLTHCGWNSMLESVSGGVPVICWPFFADQQTNCHYSCTKWGMGMEINNDVNSDEVANVVREMIGGEKGKRMRKKAREWKRMAEEATNVGGSSYMQFDKIATDILPKTLPLPNGMCNGLTITANGA